MADDPRTEARRRLLDWARGEADMPWSGNVFEAVADRLGVAVFQVRSMAEAEPVVPEGPKP